MTTFIILTIAAFLTAIVSAIAGMAGGIMLIGVMAALLAPGIVVPLHGIVQLASNFTRTLVFLKHVTWRIFIYYAIPLTFGIWGATKIWSGSLSWFKPVIGLFIILFLISRAFIPKLKNPPMIVYPFLGLIVGFASIFIGATGPLLGPFFLRDDHDNESVIATLAVCQAWGHALKIPAFLSLDFDYTAHWELLLLMIAGVALGTLVGKKILAKISRRAFNIIFQGLLVILAIYLILADWLKTSAFG